jgi:hypothetical protein
MRATNIYHTRKVILYLPYPKGRHLATPQVTLLANFLKVLPPIFHCSARISTDVKYSTNLDMNGRYAAKLSGM